MDVGEVCYFSGLFNLFFSLVIEEEHLHKLFPMSSGIPQSRDPCSIRLQNSRESDSKKCRLRQEWMGSDRKAHTGISESAG